MLDKDGDLIALVILVQLEKLFCLQFGWVGHLVWLDMRSGWTGLGW